MNNGETYLRLGEMLVQRGVLTVRKLQRGLEVARESRRRLGDVLVDLRYVTEVEIARCLAIQYGFRYEDLSHAVPSAEALDRLTPEFALRWGVLPMREDDRYWCVIADPLNVELSDMLAAIARKPVVCSLAPRSALQKAIRSAYNLPNLKVVSGSRRKAPQPESVLQRDREMLLAAIHVDSSREALQRKAA
jgi:type IV pilus assembly protein PilB